MALGIFYAVHFVKRGARPFCHLLQPIRRIWHSIPRAALTVQIPRGMRLVRTMMPCNNGTAPRHCPMGFGVLPKKVSFLLAFRRLIRCEPRYPVCAFWDTSVCRICSHEPLASGFVINLQTGPPSFAHSGIPTVCKRSRSVFVKKSEASYDTLRGQYAAFGTTNRVRGAKGIAPAG